MIDINIEKYLPHRSRMLLIDGVAEIADESIKALATVSPQWPLVEEGYVSPMICIELIAQSAGINHSWSDEQKGISVGARKGWIVGVKKALFHVDSIPVGTGLSVLSRKRSSLDNYVEIEGEVKSEDNLLSKVVLQVFHNAE